MWFSTESAWIFRKDKKLRLLDPQAVESQLFSNFCKDSMTTMDKFLLMGLSWEITICIMWGNILLEWVKSQVSFWGVLGPISDITLELVIVRLRGEPS